MYFAQFFKIKSFLVSVFISIILTSLTTFLYTKYTPGKTKVTVILKEDYSPDIYFIINKNNSLDELFERARLQYFINNLKGTDNLKNLIFYKNINIENLKLECKKNLHINYIEINNKTFAIEIADKTQNIEAINLCISSTVNFINDSINDEINKIVNDLKFYYQKYPFVYIPPEIIVNENLNLLYKNFLNLENKIKKNPIKIESRFETSISKYTDVKIYFITLFVCYFIIVIFILERKKIFKIFKY